MKEKALATLAIVALLTAAPALAQANTVTTSTRVPVNLTLFNPCTGELIDFSGNLHIVDHVTFVPHDPDGGLHLNRKENWQGVAGIDQTTGNRYRLTGVRHNLNLNANAPLPFVLTLVRTQNVISRGSADNLQLRRRVHVTVNANGTTTVDFDSFSLICEG